MQDPDVVEATFDFTRQEQLIVDAPSFHSHGACVQSAKLPANPSMAGQKENWGEQLSAATAMEVKLNASSVKAKSIVPFMGGPP